MSADRSPVLLAPDEGRALAWRGDLTVYKALGTETADSYCLLWTRVPRIVLWPLVLLVLAAPRFTESLLTPQADLLADFPYNDSLPKLENPWHADRIVTLRQAAELYAKEPDNFLPLEIYV